MTPLGLAFTRGELRLSININEFVAGILDVDISILNPDLRKVVPGPGEVTVEPPATPSGPAPTTNPATSGLPADVPLYPGATNLQQFGTAWLFNAPDAPEIVASFYRSEMVQNGWSLITENSQEGQIVQGWQKGDRIASMQVMIDESKTTVTLAVISE